MGPRSTASRWKGMLLRRAPRALKSSKARDSAFTLPGDSSHTHRSIPRYVPHDKLLPTVICMCIYMYICMVTRHAPGCDSRAAERPPQSSCTRTGTCSFVADVALLNVHAA